MSISITKFYRDYLELDRPYEHQEKVWQLMNEGKFPIILRAPTGSGKTEAVVAPFLHQHLTGSFTIAPRLIYVLPTRVLVNTLTERIKKYASKLPNKITVVAHHGAFPGSAYFVQDIVVTTLDQFVYAYARSSQQAGRHIDLPAGAIAASLIVFDEAHMYHDKFTFAILKALFEILHASRIPYVVMTATLPKTLEESLFQNIDLNEESSLKVNMRKSSKLNINILNEMLLENSKLKLPEELLEKIQKKKTLIVVNRVDTAQKVYLELKNKLNIGLENKLVLLHSRFKKKDRDENESKALSSLNSKVGTKLIKPDGPAIVVSTQVVEAGIDFSAEVLITEISPADSLVQRIGRCARYDGEIGDVFIFSNKLDRPGLSSESPDEKSAPYHKEDLIATLQKLASERIDFTSFEAVTDFVNVLNYQADDYEASEALIDLFECTLYADSKPENIQARNSKPIRLLVLPDEPRKPEELATEMVKNLSFAENTVSIRLESLAWFLGKTGKAKNCKLYKLRWNVDKKTFKKEQVKLNDENVKEGATFNPYELYALAGDCYNEELGLVF